MGLHCGRHIHPLVKYNNASVAQVPVDSVPNYLSTEFANTRSRPRHFAPAAFFARSTTTSRVRSAGRSSQVTTTFSNTPVTGSSWLFVRMYPRHNVTGTDSACAVLKTFPEAYAERGATIEAEERDARLDTPVFVCQLSFPGMPTMLHFFEPRYVMPCFTCRGIRSYPPRYRLMLRRCLDSPHPCFGMIPPPRAAPSASASGTSTGNDYGTMLAIRNVQMLPDGRSLVETWGTWRFRVMERGTLDGYMVARIERIEDYEEELDDAAAVPEDPSEDEERQDTAEVGPDDDGVRQNPLGGRAMGSTTATAQVEEQHEAAVIAELGDAATAAQTASILAPQSRPGAIHASSSTSLAESNSSRSHGPNPPTSQDEPVAPKDKNPAASGAGAMPSSPQGPRPPTNAELMAKCHAFIDQMREGTPWVVQHLNNNYIPMPSDAASFSFWMALVRPTSPRAAVRKKKQN